MEWVNFIVSILSSLAIAIPLVAKLIEYIKKSIKERNWSKLLDLVIKLVSEAENKFENSSDRKEWVLSMVKASADTIDYDIDLSIVGDLIDKLCKLAKVVNSSVQENK